eukprot:1180279-Prorocentrum_minimum.AAC.2
MLWIIIKSSHQFKTGHKSVTVYDRARPVLNWWELLPPENPTLLPSILAPAQAVAAAGSSRALRARRVLRSISIGRPPKGAAGRSNRRSVTTEGGGAYLLIWCPPRSRWS